MFVFGSLKRRFYKLNLVYDNQKPVKKVVPAKVVPAAKNGKVSSDSDSSDDSSSDDEVSICLCFELLITVCLKTKSDMISK